MTNTFPLITVSCQYRKERKWKINILFRDSIEQHYSAEHIRLNVQLLSVNKIQHEFGKLSVPEYQRGTGERIQTLLAQRSDRFIIQKLQLTEKTLDIPKVSHVNYTSCAN